MVKRGVAIARPIDAAQIALYHAYMELPEPALFTALNRDTWELHAELLRFDAVLAQRMSDRAVEVMRASDARIDHWLAFDRRRVNRGYGGYDNWCDEDFERDPPISNVSVGEILEKALGIEPVKWARGDQMRVSAYLKARKWERYKAWGAGAREWRYRRSGWVAD